MGLPKLRDHWLQNRHHEFKLDSSDKSVDDSKPTDEGKGVKLTTWMSRTDYMSKYPNTSMVDYLSSLPYGPSDFMTPNPNFPGAWDQNYKGYENYFMNGDLSALGNREGTPKPRHSTTTPDKAKKWGGKTKEEILAELDADISKYTAAEKAAHQEMRSIALELGMDFVSLIGGLFTGGTTAAPVLGKLGVKLLEPKSDLSPDLVIDGADEVAPDLSMIKGGGGALLWEKIVAHNSKRRIYMADSTKLVRELGHFLLPVEVISFGHELSLIHISEPTRPY